MGRLKHTIADRSDRAGGESANEDWACAHEIKLVGTSSEGDVSACTDLGNTEHSKHFEKRRIANFLQISAICAGFTGEIFQMETVGVKPMHGCCSPLPVSILKGASGTGDANAAYVPASSETSKVDL